MPRIRCVAPLARFASFLIRVRLRLRRPTRAPLGCCKSWSHTGARHRRPKTVRQGRADRHRRSESTRDAVACADRRRQRLGAKAKDLTLKFADRDALEIASALANTKRLALMLKLQALFNETPPRLEFSKRWPVPYGADDGTPAPQGLLRYRRRNSRPKL